MAVLSLRPVSPCSLWKATDRPIPQLSNSSFLSQPSPLHYHSLTSTSSSPPGTLWANRTRNCTAPMSISIQMEEAAATSADQALKSEPELNDIPTLVDITIPPESLAGFEADYERVSATWPADLESTKDYTKIEQFVSSAHALARRWLPQELVSRLEHFIYDPKEGAALVIRGLPFDKELPPTKTNAHLGKAGKIMTETWLVGIGRIVGQVFTFEFLRGSRPGMGLLVRELYTTAEKVEQVSAEGSRQLLDFHVDFFQLSPLQFPNVIGFIAVRGDPNKDGKTLLCDNRKLYRILDQADIQLLRTEKITWRTAMGVFSRYVIEGSESHPKFHLLEENFPEVGGFEKAVLGSAEAVAAYKRVKEAAVTLAEGVWLGSGEVLLLNQKKVTHGRSPYNPKFDGNDRWLQRAYINSGGFWEAGLSQWPNRDLPWDLPYP